MDSLKEECGIFAIFSKRKRELKDMVRQGLLSLQHRGEESCGITVSDDGIFFSEKGLGLVSDVFTQDRLNRLPQGEMAVGHVRYSTSGDNDVLNAQPIIANHIKGHMAVCHNGNLVNSYKLREKLEMRGCIFQTTSDTEVISYIITNQRLHSESTEEALLKSMDILEGAYSLAIMTPTKIICCRDRHGFRPLCYGQCADGTYVIASESCALDSVGAKFIRDILPGEIVVFSEEGVKSITSEVGKKEEKICVFEYIYFARQDSVIEGLSVHKARMKAGEILARLHPVDADVVVGVPDSGIDGALGFSRASGIPYSVGLLKSKYVGRTFIANSQELRENLVKLKLNPIKDEIEGKRVVLIDDSIVRGTTSAKIVKLVREAGAKEVHMRLTCPPFIHSCHYGTDVDEEKNLIAYHHTIDEIAKIINVDTLGYLDLKSLSEMLDLGGRKITYCDACFSGNYPTSIEGIQSKSKFERRIHREDR